jgi:pyrimidine-nucleoside phosphorylase
MDARAILRRKRDGAELTDAEIEAFLAGYVAGEVPDYVASALLAVIFVRGMSARELEAWTRAMLASGRRFRFDGLGRPAADKHSTGGVGDKVSLPLAPAVAACGVAVPMISGRGLGHTGGTLDKLESIPGLRTDLAPERFQRLVAEVGFAMAGQTADLVPADRKLYALRDATGLVESIPLVASSILSKKLAEGIDALVLDVKYGSGAFFPDPERGAELARTMIGLARGMGLSALALQTAMDRPLGRAVGNALEVRESIECLRGGGPDDLRELVCALGGAMLAAVGAEPDGEAGALRIGRALDDGSALERFGRMVAAQGGDARAVEEPARLPAAPECEVVAAPADGRLGWRDVSELGRAVVALGGGRRRLEDAVDPAVGVVLLSGSGAEVARGAPLLELHHRAGRGLAEARERIGRALAIGPAPELGPLILARVEG